MIKKLKKVLGICMSLTISTLLIASGTSTNASESPDYSSNSYTQDLTEGQNYFASSSWFPAVQAFDNNTTYSFNGWMGEGNTNEWVGVDFAQPKAIQKLTLVNCSIPQTESYTCKEFLLQYSDNKTEWNNACSKPIVLPNDYTKHEYTFSSFGKHEYWRVFILNNYNIFRSGICEIEMMEQKVDSPSAIVLDSADNLEVGTTFNVTTVLKNVNSIREANLKIALDPSMLEHFEYLGLVSGFGFNQVTETKESDTVFNYNVKIGSTNPRDNITGNGAIFKLRFKAKKPGQGKIDILQGKIYDNLNNEYIVSPENCGEKVVTVAGQVLEKSYSEDLTKGQIYSASSIYTNYYNTYPVSNAFNDDTNSLNGWLGGGNSNEWAAVEFDTPRTIEKVTLQGGNPGYQDNTGANLCKDFIVQYSDDKANWYDAYAGTLPPDYDKHEYTFEYKGAHKNWRILVLGNYNPTTSPRVGLNEIEMMEAK